VNTTGDEVRYEHLRPRGLRARIEGSPVVYVPLGIVEWHGHHNVYGSDILKMYAVLPEVARRAGGVVHPPVWVATESDLPGEGIFGTLVYSEAVFRGMIGELLAGLRAAGFRLIVLFAGHSSALQEQVLEQEAVAFMKAHDDVRVLATSDYEICVDHDYKIYDHAAKYETGMMMAQYPESVDLGECPDELVGVVGRDPRRHSSAESGRQMIELMKDRLVEWVDWAWRVDRQELVENDFRLSEGPPCWPACPNFHNMTDPTVEEFYRDPWCCCCRRASRGVVGALVEAAGADYVRGRLESWAKAWRERFRNRARRLLRQWEELTSRTGL